MNVIICGAGQVGHHAAEVLAAAGNNITLVDKNAERIRKIEDTMDVRTLRGNCATASVLVEAGCDGADLLLAATDSDEINLLSASIAKAVGAARSIARVHHSAFFEQRGLDYLEHFSIDQLICPEYSTAQAIARTLRNPGAMAIEEFARGQVEMQEFAVSDNAPSAGLSLAELDLPRGARLAAITRGRQTVRERGPSDGRTAFIPDGASVVEAGDGVVLVGNAGVFQQARKLFCGDEPKRRKVVLMGGPSMAVWVCRALRNRGFSIRLFEIKRDRAEELAQKLSWVTVIQGDPTDRSTFDEEHIADADAFVALLDDDEHNILGSAWAKSMGVKQAIAVVQRPDYIHLLKNVGIDKPFSPRMVAVKEIEQLLDEAPLRRVSSLAEGIVDVYSVRVGKKAKMIGKPLRSVKLSPNWIVAAIQHDQKVVVPGADDTILAGDTVLVIGRAGMEGKLKKLFAAG